MALLTWVLLIYFAITHVVGTLVLALQFRWKIPVVILRYTGDKGRPVLLIKKARKKMQGGVPKLQVRGYGTPINDFKAHNYFPTARGGFGGLILWEFEDGLLTPTVPVKVWKKMPEERKKLLKELFTEVESAMGVSFEYDDRLYQSLRLKAVDDVDIESMVYEIARTEKQYIPGWQNFLNQYGWMFGWILLGILLLVTVVMGFNRAPEIANACAQVAVNNADQITKAVADYISSGAPA